MVETRSAQAAIVTSSCTAAGCAEDGCAAYRGLVFCSAHAAELRAGRRVELALQVPRNGADQLAARRQLVLRLVQAGWGQRAVARGLGISYGSLSRDVLLARQPSVGGHEAAALDVVEAARQVDLAVFRYREALGRAAAVPRPRTDRRPSAVSSWRA